MEWERLSSKTGGAKIVLLASKVGKREKKKRRRDGERELKCCNKNKCAKTW